MFSFSPLIYVVDVVDAVYWMMSSNYNNCTHLVHRTHWVQGGKKFHIYYAWSIKCRMLSIDKLKMPIYRSCCWNCICLHVDLSVLLFMWLCISFNEMNWHKYWQKYTVNGSDFFYVHYLSHSVIDCLFVNLKNS